MSKETFYFSHDYGARNDPKLMNVLMDLGCEGIGAYWCIIEQLYEQGGSITLKSCRSIAFALRIEEEKINRLVLDYGLFENDGSSFWSLSVNRRTEIRQEISEKRRKSAQKRWGSNTCNAKAQDTDANASPKNAIALQVHSDSIQLQCNKKKEKEKKENTSSNDDDKKENKEKSSAPSGAPSPSPSLINDFGDCRLYGLDELLIRMQSDGGWIRAVSENLKLIEKPGGASAAIQEFIEELRIKGVKSKREDDAKQHFVNWIRIKQKTENNDTDSYTPARKVYQGTGKSGSSFNDGKPKRYRDESYKPNPNRKI